MSMYYDYDKLLSRDFLIAFVISERGLGKTFGAKKAVLNRWLKSGGEEEFIYVRRYKTELDSSLATFWNDLQSNGYFEEHTLKVQKSKLLTKFTCDNKVCGYAVPLSTSNILKSTAFPKVKYIIFDEYLLAQGGTYRYLKGEMNLFLDLIETVFRLRDGKVLMLGNALNVYASPYFAYWDLDIPYGVEFKSYKDGAILVHYARNEEYREKKKQSKFGKLIDGTDYGRYAIDNEDVSINHLFIQKRPEKAVFTSMLIINGNKIGMWNGKDGYLYLSEKVEPNTLNKFAFDFTDHTEGTIFNSVRENYYVHVCVEAYKHGWLKFENERVKANVISLLNRCISF